MKGALVMMRKRYSAEEKVMILKEHLEKQVSVADICEKYRIHPNQFYRWKKELFESAVEIFSKSRDRKKRSVVKELEATLKDRNDVIIELLEENLKLKKFNGGL